MIKHIIFDMDGTLIDSERMIISKWKDVAAEFHIPDIEETLMQCIGINSHETETLFHRIYGEDFPYRKYTSMVSRRFHDEINANGLPVKPGTYQLFHFLKENHYQIGLASSTREAVVREEMKSIGLLDYFHVVVGGDMVSNSKPHPEIYLTAAKLLGVSPNQCYAVEDSPNGIRSAYQAGMATLMVPDLIAPDEELRQMIFRQFQNLLELQDFLAVAQAH